MKDNKASLILIIVLLVIFLPLTLLGTINKVFNKDEGNRNHKLFYEGHLWFYNNDELLGKYECMTSVCNLANSIIDDNEYGIEYYSDGNVKNVDVIHNKYAFIRDGDDINLFDIKGSIVLQKYKAIKTYNTTLDNDIYILKNNDNKWGIISVNESISAYLPFEYDFIGISNKIVNEKLDISKFIVKKDNLWSIIDKSGNLLSKTYDKPIINYTNGYVFTRNGSIEVYDKDNIRLLSDLLIRRVLLNERYIAIICDNNMYLYTTLSNEPLKTYQISSSDDKIEIINAESVVSIKVNDKLIDTLAVN